jgi:glycosyltransferase involved in cell wall biosynthesis
MAGSKRFAIVSPNFFPRVCGVGDHSARLGTELKRRGHEVAIFSRAPVSPHPTDPTLEIHGVDGRWPAQVASGISRAVEQWAPTDLLLQYTPQMWDAWRFGSLASAWVAVRARSSGVRVTLIAHELYIPWGFRPDLMLGAGAQRLQFAGILKSVDRSFVTTDTRAASIGGLCRLLGVREPAVIRVGANILPIARQRGTAGASAPRIGLFSTAAAGKRFDVVLWAFQEIVGSYPQAELVIIGDLGDPTLPRVRAITDAIARHPTRARIRTTGRLSLSEIAVQMADLDLYLFPMDTGANTRSGTLPAALGSGLPVVAVRGPETDLALFRDGENILFAHEMTGAAFAEAALRLLRDPALMTDIGREARRLHDACMTWERIADSVLEV